MCYSVGVEESNAVQRSDSSPRVRSRTPNSNSASASSLATWPTRLTFRFGLLRAAYTREALEAAVARSRFGRGDILLDGIGFELRLVK